MIFRPLGVDAGLDLADREAARSSAPHLGAVIRRAGVLGQLTQKIAGRTGVVVSADVDGRAAKDRTQDAAGLAVSVEMSPGSVGGAGRILHGEIGHEVAPSGHGIVFFRRLLIAIAAWVSLSR